MSSDRIVSIGAVLCFIVLLIPSIVLLSLYRHDDIKMNSWGYVNPGGSCREICSDYGGCGTFGTINVTFSPLDNSTTTTMLIPVLSPCTVLNDLCCETLIEDHTVVWFNYVDGQVNEMSLTSISNSQVFVTIGVVLLALSLAMLIFWIKMKFCDQPSYRTL